MSNPKHAPVSLALCTALAGGLALSGSAFAMQPMAQGYLLAPGTAAASEKAAEGKCGAGKMADGSCGADKKAAEGKCGMDKVDTDKDGRISRDEANAGKGGFAQRFADMDVNKDGYLDRADRELRMTRERAAFFGGADANKDGKLSRDEFVVEQGARGAERREQFAKRAETAGKPIKARPAPTEAEQLQRAGKAFDRMDANKDGTVTRAEFDAAKPMHGGKGPHSRKG